MKRVFAAAVIIFLIIVLFVFLPALTRMSRRAGEAREEALVLKAELEDAGAKIEELESLLAESRVKAGEMESVLEEYRVKVRRLEYMLEEAEKTGEIPDTGKVEAPRG